MPSIKIPEINREVYETVVKSIYTDPKKASVREIIANAVDANREILYGSRPVEVNFGYHSVTVRDYGTGISPETMLNIYGSMYQSTKRSSNPDEVTTANGEHGIGSKAPYGVLYDMFERDTGHAGYYIVKTICDNTAYIYSMFISDDGIPSYDLIKQYPTDEERGTEITLPLSFNALEGSSELNDLVDIIAPYYVTDDKDVLAIKGNNRPVVNIITETLDQCIKYENMYFYPNAIEDSTESDIKVKYKNILYPIYDYDLSWKSKSMRGFYEIDLNMLSAPLAVSRSRDRIDFDYDEKEKIVFEINTNLGKLSETISSNISILIGSSKYKKPLKYNKLIEKLKEYFSSYRYESSYGMSSHDITNSDRDYVLLYEEKIIDKTCLSKLSNMKWVYGLDIVESIMEPELSPSDLENDSITNLRLFSEIFSFNNFLRNQEEKHSTVEDYLFRKVQSNNIVVAANDLTHGIVVRQMDSMGYTEAKRTIRTSIRNDKDVFIIRDKGSYKKELACLYDDQLANTKYDAAYIVDVRTKDTTEPDSRAIDYINMFQSEGVSNIFILSELNEKYKNKIKAVKPKSYRPKNKRIKGISEITKHDYGGSLGLKYNHRKTINSSELEDIAKNNDDIYVVSYNTTSPEIINAYNDDMVFSFKTQCHSPDDGGTDIIDMIFESGLTRATISHSDMCELLPKGSILMSVKEEQYDNVMEYFEDNNVINFNDYVKSFLENTKLTITRSVNANSIVSYAEEIRDEIQGQYWNSENNSIKASAYTDANVHEASRIHIFVGKVFQIYDIVTSDEDKLIQYQKSFTSKQMEFIKKFMTIRENPENKDIAQEFFDYMLNKKLVITLICDMSNISLNKYNRMIDDDAQKLFVDHILELSDLNFFKEKHLTDKE